MSMMAGRGRATSIHSAPSAAGSGGSGGGVHPGDGGESMGDLVDDDDETGW